MLIGIREMLSLVLNAEKTIKDAVVNAYKQLYFKNKNSDSLIVTNQLIKLVKDLNKNEPDAFEELVCEFVSSGELDNSIIEILFEILANNDPQQDQNRLNVLILLGMIINRIPEKGRDNIILLIDYAFVILNEKEATDTEMIKISETCHVFSLMGTESKTRSKQDSDELVKKNRTSNNLIYNKPFKLFNNHLLFTKLEDIICK